MLAQLLIIFVGGISTGVLLSVLVQALIHALRKRSAARSASLLPSEGQSSPRAHWWQAGWIRTWMRWSGLVIAPILLNGFYASFAIARTTLQHIDPVVFAALQLTLLLPVATVVLCCTLRSATKESVRLGLLGGLPLGAGFVCIALSLRNIGIIPTAMLTALDGMAASLIAWLVFRQRLSLYTCLAVVCAGAGAFLLWWIAPSRWQTDFVALMCGLLFTVYAFHVERNAIVRGAIRQRIFPFFGGLFFAMAAVALILALCFGHWETLQTATEADLLIVLYCGLGTVLIPLIMSTFLLRYVSTVTWAFLAVLEPLLSLVFAYLLGAISLGLFGWCGVTLIFLSILLQANAGRPRSTKQARPDAAEPEPAISASGSAAG